MSTCNRTSALGWWGPVLLMLVAVPHLKVGFVAILILYEKVTYSSADQTQTPHSSSFQSRIVRVCLKTLGCVHLWRNLVA